MQYSACSRRNSRNSARGMNAAVVVLARFRRDPILFPAHALAQPEHGSRADDLQKLPLTLTGRQQDPHFAALHQVYARDRGTLLKQRGAFGEHPNRFDPLKSPQQIGAQLPRRGLRRHNVTPFCLSLSCMNPEPGAVIWRTARSDKRLGAARSRLHLSRPSWQRQKPGVRCQVLGRQENQTPNHVQRRNPLSDFPET